ncbi:MAG: hypothetical protein FWE53_01220 [Firmicutes bacterium]|nr:hypothetical protein [Bacillota bacterium]
MLEQSYKAADEIVGKYIKNKEIKRHPEIRSGRFAYTRMSSSNWREVEVTLYAGGREDEVPYGRIAFGTNGSVGTFIIETYGESGLEFPVDVDLPDGSVLTEPAIEQLFLMGITRNGDDLCINNNAKAANVTALYGALNEISVASQLDTSDATRSVYVYTSWEGDAKAQKESAGRVVFEMKDYKSVSKHSKDFFNAVDSVCAAAMDTKAGIAGGGGTSEMNPK